MDQAFFDRLGDGARRAIAGVADITPDNKDDAGFDPVTEADRAAERALRTMIEAHFPGDAIWGEEYGWTRQGAGRTWSLDPIDGTRAFICDTPSWAILVGLLEGEDHVAGMIDLPALDERLVATGGETRCGDEVVQASGCDTLGSARISTVDPYLFDADCRARFERLLGQVRTCRYSLDALAFARVATGGIDVALDHGLKRHDYDALVPVVRGAGGHVGNWSGGSDLSGGDVIAAASETLYEQVVEALA